MMMMLRVDVDDDDDVDVDTNDSCAAIEQDSSKCVLNQCMCVWVCAQVTIAVVYTPIQNEMRSMRSN